MKKLEILTTFFQYDSLDELSAQEANLMLEAIEIRKKAYAPYSKFRVGAALLMESGQIVLGSNQENAAYPSGLCAERTAIFQAGALYPNERIKMIAISASSDLKLTQNPIPPCGACRQSMLEYESLQTEPIQVLFMGATGIVLKSPSILNLIPFHFDNKVL